MPDSEYEYQSERLHGRYRDDDPTNPCIPNWDGVRRIARVCRSWERERDDGDHIGHGQQQAAPAPPPVQQQPIVPDDTSDFEDDFVQHSWESDDEAAAAATLLAFAGQGDSSSDHMSHSEEEAW